MVGRRLVSITLVLTILALMLFSWARDNHWLAKSALAQEFPDKPVQCFPNNTRVISMKEAAQHALNAGFQPDQGNQGSDAATIVAIAWAESGGEIFACN